MRDKQTTPDLTASVSGFGLSYAITSILSALLVVIKESDEVIHNWMVVLTGHHWVTHGLLDLVVFLVLGFAFSRMGSGIRMSVNALIMTIVAATVLSGLIIACYFI